LGFFVELAHFRLSVGCRLSASGRGLLQRIISCKFGLDVVSGPLPVQYYGCYGALPMALILSARRRRCKPIRANGPHLARNRQELTGKPFHARAT
jgi:hypothetical protein